MPGGLTPSRFCFGEKVLPDLLTRNLQAATDHIDLALDEIRSIVQLEVKGGRSASDFLRKGSLRIAILFYPPEQFCVLIHGLPLTSISEDALERAHA